MPKHTLEHIPAALLTPVRGDLDCPHCSTTFSITIGTAHGSRVVTCPHCAGDISVRHEATLRMVFDVWPLHESKRTRQDWHGQIGESGQ